MGTYELFHAQREEAQELTAEMFANMRNQDISLIEFPTGFGKTYIDIRAAIRYKEKKNTPVIISTNTNKNALAIGHTYKNICTEYGLDEEGMVVEIGRSNYIDIERLYHSIEENPSLFPNISAESLKENYMLESSPLMFKNNILLYHFLEKYGYSSSKMAAFSSFLQDDVKSISPKSLKHIEELLLSNKIIVTNHAYLIILFRYYGNPKNKHIDPSVKELLFSCPIIMDEVHTLYDAARSIFTNRFSLFRLKYSMIELLSLGKKSLTLPTRKSLNLILSNIIETEGKISKTEDTLEIQSHLAYFKSIIGGSTKLKRVEEAIKKTYFKSEDGEKYARFVTTELNELSVINLEKRIGTKVELSPKGFPTVEVNNKVASYELRSTLWSKHNGPCMGMSGTLRTETGDGVGAYQWIKERLGLFLVDEVSNLESLSGAKNIDEETKTFLLEQNKVLNTKINNIKTKRHVSLFNKSNYLYTVVKDKSLKIPMGSQKQNDLYEAQRQQWRKSSGIFIANNLRYNSLVLVVGYEDAEHIAKEIISQRSDISVHYAKEGISMHDTVEKYKNDINSGKTACLVGTEQYYIGLDLKGNYLQELYMGKIPYQHPSGKIGKKIYKHFSFDKTESYRHEAMMKFLQGKGRAIRDYHDKAILYVLDDRILDSRRGVHRDFLNESAVQSDYMHVLKNRHKIFGSEGLSKYAHIHILFYEYFGNIPIGKVLQLLDISEEESGEVDDACRFLMALEYIKEKQELLKIIDGALQSEKYTIWQLLFKLALDGYGKREALEKEIIENKLFGFEDISALGKAFFLGENISPALSALRP